MLTTLRATFASLMLMLSFNVNADMFGGGGNNFFGGDDCPPWVNDCNEWPEWTPMYWMEEFANEMDDDDDYYGGGYGGYPQQMPYGYAPQMPYGYAPQMPYGYAPQQMQQMPPMMQRPNQNVAPYNRPAPAQ
ncbi:MAG: hypothetical protein ISR69_08740 [Gammaproteobacteria bacterium]|nr:hypothetical protein [Gammaproteobacteria bacterium]